MAFILADAAVPRKTRAKPARPRQDRRQALAAFQKSLTNARR